MTTDLETYRLRSKGEQALCINSDYWRCPGLYLSSVCMAVHLKPKETWSAPESMDKYKEDLRTLLRGLAQRLLEHNLWRPLVAVLEDDKGRFAGLAADQEWHRGEFLLYAEKKEPASRLKKVLMPDDIPINESHKDFEQDGAVGYRKRLIESVKELGESAEMAANLLDRLLPSEGRRVRAKRPEEEEGEGGQTEIYEYVSAPSVDSIEKLINNWCNNIKKEAKELELKEDGA